MRHSPGFTKIELLAVLTILLVLACFALRWHGADRARAVDAQVAATVRTVAASMEKFFAINEAYAADVDALGDVATGGVEVTIEPGNTGDLRSSFRVVATHLEARTTYTWTSDPPAGEANLVANRSGVGGVAARD